MRRPSTFLLLCALAGACGGGDGGPGHKGGKGGPESGEEESDDADPNRRVLVQVAAVERAQVRDELATTGVLESEAQADIVPETSGTVTRS